MSRDNMALVRHTDLYRGLRIVTSYTDVC